MARRSALEVWRDAPRELGFQLGRIFTVSPPSLKRRTSSGEAAVRPLGPDALARHAELAARYDLSPWPSICTGSEYRESLYVLDLCDRHLTGRIPRGRRLDVGSKNGAYLPGLCAAFPDPVDGVELDAHRRYWNLATRRGHALGLLRPYPAARYLAGSVEALAGPYAAITWLLPFVSPEPFDAWGLPRRFFGPGRLLAHVLSLLAPGGVLLIVNQEEEEASAQQALFDEAGVTAEALGVLSSPVSPFRLRRFGFRVTREAR